MDGQVILDPDVKEEQFEQSNVTVAVMSSLNEVTQMLQTGEMEHTKAPEASQYLHFFKKKSLACSVVA